MPTYIPTRRRSTHLDSLHTIVIYLTVSKRNFCSAGSLLCVDLVNVELDHEEIWERKRDSRVEI